MAKPERTLDSVTQTATRRNLWDSRAFMLAISLAAAVVLWCLVTMVFDPQSSKTMSSGIEVNYSYDSSKYTAQGLSIVDTVQPANVVVEFKGNGTIIGGIQTSDFIVYPNYSTVKGSGETRLSLSVIITNSNYSSVKASVKSPSAVTVVFDTVSEKTLPVTVEASGITVGDHYVLSKQTAVPAEVTLTGPTNELENIRSVVAPVTTDEVLTDSRTIPTLLELRDGEGNSVTSQYTTMDNESADVTMTVYKVRELPLTIDFIDTPSGFDKDSLKYVLSQKTMRVAGPAKVVDPLTELSVASFDLAQQFAFDRDYQLQVELPTGLEALDGIDTITLSFDTDKMASKTLNVSNIRCINVPSNYSIEVLTDRVSGVVFYGPVDEIDELSAQSVSAQIDCQSISVTTGQQTMSVSMSIPSSSHIFATGSYTVLCQVTAK